MFIKGMKYEFRAVARIVLPMFIVSLCAAMIMSMGFILDGRVFHFTETTENEILPILFGIAEALVGLGLIFLMIAINIAVFVMIVYRFYVSFFTDEGYLTFTLPLTMDCHLMIKIVSMFLWNLLSLIVTAIAGLIIFGGVAVGYTDALKATMPEIRYVFRAIMETFQSVYGISQIWLWIVSAIIAYIFQSFLLYFSIALGCMIFKKNRLLGAIISVFAIDTVYSTITSFGSSMLMTFGMLSETAFAVASVIGIVFSVVGMVVLYYATKYILERKLNLD